MKPDLHCHSCYSDGAHSPDFLYRRAIENGITHLAITDHDCIEALVKPIDDYHEIQIIPGVEISCEWGTQEIHLVGLCIEHENSQLISLLEQQQKARYCRMQAMDKLLVENGIDGLQDYLNQLPCKAFTRSHVADFLLRSGKVKSKQKAFKRFLGKRGKAYVPFQWEAMVKAIEIVKAANGIAVIAHPGRYSLSLMKLELLISQFKQMGGDAIEVSYGAVQPKMQKKLEDLAEKYSLYVSVGSDFHNADAHWTDIGKYPRVSSSSIKNAVWNHPKWHSL
ncbi:MAG: PHP domain-containing protein [Pseudomonadota bacterium]|nr:PHP domain-containing protein [Pseudomonadota bacterium]